MLYVRYSSSLRTWLERVKYYQIIAQDKKHECVHGYGFIDFT